MVLADKQAKHVQWTNVYLDALVCILQFMLQILFFFLKKSPILLPVPFAQEYC